LNNINILKGCYWYLDFFTTEILSRIVKLNQHDTINNKALNTLLDKDGYLTVYHGRCSKTMRNANSWSLKKEDAICIGRINSLLYEKTDFYCVTGKVRLNDVIAPINGRTGKGVATLQKNVKRVAKDIYSADDVKIIETWHGWV
jgi:hypothetical protein